VHISFHVVPLNEKAVRGTRERHAEPSGLR
jgi:hypothetical protein